MNETELPQHVYNSKDHGFDKYLSWDIQKKATSYQCGSKRWDLCFSEKVSIFYWSKNVIKQKKWTDFQVSPQ